MWRYLAGAGGALALAGAGMVLFSGRATPPTPLLAAAPAAAEETSDEEQDALPGSVPSASQKTREQKRFGRLDKDKDGSITRDEFLVARRRAFAKLDRNGDGQLSFEESSVKAITRFTTADRDRSGAMNAAEFATTRVVRRARPRVNCPPAPARGEAAETEES